MKEQLDIAKSAFDLSKQVLIAVVLLFLVFYPAAIGGALDKMGITEGDIWGLKWKKEFKRTDDALQQSQADQDRLSAQLKLANETIQKQAQIIVSLQSKPTAGAPESDPRVGAVVKAANDLIGQNQSTINATRQNSQAIQQTIVSNTQLVARAQEGDSTPAQWVILTGSDPSEAAAMDEVKRAKDAGFDAVKMIHSRGVYRSGIVYRDRQIAAAALDSVRSKTRQDAYIVSMEKFCPNGREVRPDFIECGN